MRRFDKKKNMEKVNRLFEQRNNDKSVLLEDKTSEEKDGNEKDNA